jgi:polyisoprenoid-binding protein YceI
MNVVGAAVPLGVWNADSLHSNVAIEVQHMGVSTFRAGFTDFDAGLVSGPDGVELRGTARVESFDVQDEALRPHVLGPEFLDVERHPELRFRSTAARVNHDGLVLDADLTIKGRTVPIEVRGAVSGPVADPYGNERLAVTLEAVLDRTDFGLDWQMELPNGGAALANDVKLLATLEFLKDV